MRLTQEHVDVLDQAIGTWGKRQQVIKAVEEMAELSKALCKWLNLEVKVSGGSIQEADLLENIEEEIVDASLMLFQMRRIFDDPNVNRRVDAKVNRLKTYLGAKS